VSNLLKNTGKITPLHLVALKQLYQSLDPDLAAALERQGVTAPKDEQTYAEQVAAMEDAAAAEDTQKAAQGGSIVGMGALAHGGLPARYHPSAPRGHNPEFITGQTGFYAAGKGNGQSDDIPAMLNDGDYVIDADAVAALGDGSSKAGSSALDQLRTTVPHQLSQGGSAIPAKIADGEYVLPNAFVTALGNGSNKEGAKLLDGMREELRAHKRSAPTSKIPPKAKSPLDYLRMAKG